MRRSYVVLAPKKNFSQKNGRQQPQTSKKRTSDRIVKNPYKLNEKISTPNHLMHEDLFTPETAKGRKLGLLANRLIHFQLAEDSLLERYAECAIRLAPSLGPKQFGLILNAFARTNYQHPLLMNKLAAHMANKLNLFLPIDIAQVVNAYAKLQSPNKKLFRLIAEEVPHKLPYFNAPEIAIVANAYVKLRIYDTPLLEDLVDEAANRIEEFGGQALTMLVHAYAHSQINRPRAWRVLLQAAVDLGNELELSEWLQLLNAAVRTRDAPESFLEAAIMHLNNASDEMSLPQLALYLSSLARANRLEMTILNSTTDRIAEYLRARITSLDALQKEGEDLSHLLEDAPKSKTGKQKREKQKPSEVPFPGAEDETIPHKAQNASTPKDEDDIVFGRLMHAYGKLRIESPVVTPLLYEYVTKLPMDSSEHTLILTTNALARMNCPNVECFSHCAKILIRRGLENISPTNLAVIAHAFAKRNVRSQILFHQIARQCESKLPMLNGQSLAMIAWAFTKLEICPKSLLRLISKYAMLLSNELNVMECQMLLQSLERAEDSFDARLKGVLKERIHTLSPFSPEVTMRLGMEGNDGWREQTSAWYGAEKEAALLEDDFAPNVEFGEVDWYDKEHGNTVKDFLVKRRMIPAVNVERERVPERVNMDWIGEEKSLSMEEEERMHQQGDGGVSKSEKRETGKNVGLLGIWERSEDDFIPLDKSLDSAHTSERTENVMLSSSDATPSMKIREYARGSSGNAKKIDPTLHFNTDNMMLSNRRIFDSKLSEEDLFRPRKGNQEEKVNGYRGNDTKEGRKSSRSQIRDNSVFYQPEEESPAVSVLDSGLIYRSHDDWEREKMQQIDIGYERVGESSERLGGRKSKRK